MSAVAETEEPEWHQKEFLYTVLNLPVYATQGEIKERHRALSLMFHPDKQRDDAPRETAKKRFLEVQRAYEVLSDPFLREVYDALGYEGLKLNIPPQIRNLPLSELPTALRHLHDQFYTAQLEARVHARGRVTCGLDVSELFAGGWIWREWHRDLAERLRSARVTLLSVRHSFEKELGAQTKMIVLGVMSQVRDEDEEQMPLTGGHVSPVRLRGKVTTTVRHQVSPKLTVEGTANVLRRQRLKLSATYGDGPNALTVQTQLIPARHLLLPHPPISVLLARRLYRDSLTSGTISFGLTPRAPPSVSIGLTKPCIAFISPPDSGPEHDEKTGDGTRGHAKDGTMMLFDSRVATGWVVALNLRLVGDGLSLSANWIAALVTRGLQLKAGFELTLVGPLTHVTGEWISEDAGTSVSATVGVNPGGVLARLTLSHLGQTIALPFVLSSHGDYWTALYATVLPTTAYLLADYFYLRPQRVAKQLARRRARRQAHSEYIMQKKHEAEESALLLREYARRITQAEKNNDGLVILEASYFPLESNHEPILDLAVDVTVPVQALVHNGQLYFPGGRPKSSLRGFYDPLPEFPKRLSIRYEFRGRLHYAEAGDTMPLVLPLEDHLVEGYAIEK